MTGNKRYVVDSWAWIEYFDGTEAGKAVDSILNSGAEIYTNTVTVAEVASRAKRRGKDVEAVFDGMISLSKVLPVDEVSAKDAGLLHSSIKGSVPNFSLADAFALQTARHLGAKVLTGDPDFKRIKEAELIK